MSADFIYFARILYKKTLIFIDMLSININARLTRKNLHQIPFIHEANKILPEFEYSLLDLEGECSVLSNLYIQYASEGRQDIFCHILMAIVSGAALQNISREEMEAFFKQLSVMKNTYGIYLPNKKCSAVFSFISSDHLELTENTKKIIENMASFKQNLSVHITLGYLHSFVLEQRIESMRYVYYVYDPNSCAAPKKLQTSKEITYEIYMVIERIKLSSLNMQYFLNEDEHNLFTFYIYPEKIDETDVLNLYSKITDSPFKSDENIKKIINLIELYDSYLIAKNILLINIVELMKESPRAQFYFTQELQQIHREISKGLNSMRFMPLERHKSKIRCFDYVQHYGHISLLHEVARIGDVTAVKALMENINPLSQCQQKMYQSCVDWAIMGGHPLVVEILLNYLNKQYHLTKNKMYKVNYEQLAHVADCCSNGYNFSNTQAAPLSRAVFNMYKLIQSYQTNKTVEMRNTPQYKPNLQSIAVEKTQKRAHSFFCESKKDNLEVQLQRRYSF